MNNPNKLNEHDAISQALANIVAKSSAQVASSALRAESHALTINFHPDRLTTQGVPILEAIANDGAIKSQFETGTSNGGLSAFEGGDRWLWEQRVFDGAYDNTSKSARPKYGAYNYQNYPSGASPRFGSAFFTLKPAALQRTSFCYPDSFFEPSDFAVLENLQSLVTLAKQDDQDRLDDYIEAHVHGKVLIERDVESLTLDPVYRDTGVEQQALELGIPILWHAGYRLSTAKLKTVADFRGSEYVELGCQLAIQGQIDAKILGEAVNEQGYDPQAVKKVWHCLARFGYSNM